MKTKLDKSPSRTLLGVVVVGLATFGSTLACGSAFHDDCFATHSCPGQAGAEGEAESPVPSQGGGDGEGRGGGNAASGGADGGADAGGADGTGSPSPSAGAAGDAAASCAKDVCQLGTAPAHVVSTTPEDGAEDVEPDAQLVVAFSAPLDPKTVDATAFKLFDGDTEIAGTIELVDGNHEIRFTPRAPLDLWTSYRVELAANVTDARGAALADAASFSFQVRDGAWSLKSLVRGEELVAPRALPITPSGAILASWAAGRQSMLGGGAMAAPRADRGA
jgi:Bacterial Ig-like domain